MVFPSYTPSSFAFASVLMRSESAADSMAGVYKMVDAFHGVLRLRVDHQLGFPTLGRTHRGVRLALHRWV